jgi:succinate dehydrogenase / fumarate reductase cytochrome b subunit
MALSGFFLMFFLVQHLTINMLSVISPEIFNEVSHFMGTNPIVQFLLQPVLIFAVVFHFIMGIFLDIRNRKSRTVKYVYNKPSTNSNWISRNMIFSGLTVLAFLTLHFIDFWIPEMNYKYIEFLPEDATRYYPELQHKFTQLPRVICYVVSFVFLSLHLLHGFQSSFQSVGVAGSKSRITLHKFGNLFAIAIPLGFVVVAIFHFISQSH